MQRRHYRLPSESRTIVQTVSTKGIEAVMAGRDERGGEVLMARNEIRPVARLRSTAGTGFTYVTRKNRRDDPDRMVPRKFDPVARRHVEFREEH